MRHSTHRLSLGLGILGLVAAGTAAAFLAFASGGNAAGNNACTQLNPAEANCLFVSSVPSVLSANKPGLVVLRFKNIFANATATHAVLTATMPSNTSVVTNGVTTTAPANCSQQSQQVSCSFNSGVPGGSIVSMYIQFTTSVTPPATLGAVKGTVTFDEGNGGTNDSFATDSGTTSVVANINGTTGGEQGGLCTGDVTQFSGFNTNKNGQQANIGKLPKPAPGLPCTPVSAGIHTPTDPEKSACASSGPKAPCPADTAFVFFPVLQNNAAALLTLNYPTKPPGVTAVKNTPLFEFVPDGSGGLTLVQVLKCGTPSLSPDSCLAADPTKFGSQGVSFAVNVTGSTLDGSYVP